MARLRGFPSVLPSLTVGTLEVTGAATFANTVSATGQFLAGVGSVLAPSYSFTGFPLVGMYAKDNHVVLCGANIAAAAFGNDEGGSALNLFRDGIQFCTGVPDWNNIDLRLHRDAANVLAQRNGTAAQKVRVYNTWANAGVDFEHAGISWSANVCYVGTVEGRGGTGQTRTVALYAGDSLYFFTAESHRWSMNTSGHFLAVADNTYDIGASGAARPRSGYFGANIYVDGGYYQAGVKVLGAQGASVADASGGATVDAEARTAINTLLARMRTHGAIAT